MKGGLVRYVVVIASLLLTLILAAPDLERVFGHPLQVPGIGFDYNYTVNSIGRQAAVAGIRIGDRIDVAAMPVENRTDAVVAAGSERPTLSIALLRKGRRFDARVATVPESADRVVMVAVRYAVQVLCSVLGTLLLLRRPSWATWGFFFFMVGNIVPVNVALQIGPLWWRNIAQFLFYMTVDGPLQWGAVFFAIFVLQNGPLQPWRRVAVIVAGILSGANVALGALFAGTILYGAGAPALVQLLYQSLAAAALFVATALLGVTYFELGTSQRERLRWIIAGFFVCALAGIGVVLSPSFLGIIAFPYSIYSVLLCFAFAPAAIAVTYAILKHRIIDVNVAVTRATVYGVLSVGIVGVFALVDLFFTRALAERDAGWIADVGMALALGFSFNTLHKHVDTMVDRFLFRSRHLAEEYVSSLVAAVEYARDESEVRHMLLAEPVRAFGLSFARADPVTEPGIADESFSTLAALVRAERHAKRLPGELWSTFTIHFGWTPALAVPVFVHAALREIAFYSAHSNGTDLDGDEIALLERLGAAAGNAIERLESDALRRENEMLRAERAIAQTAIG